MSPDVGPIAGGTELSIRGAKLDTGANIEVTLDRHPCDVDRCAASCVDPVSWTLQRAAKHGTKL